MAVLCLLMACNDKDGKEELTEPPFFAKGADVSWITEMEAAGKRFYSADGAEKDGFVLMKELGMNTVRLRVWVDPANGWNNTADVLAKAKRAHILGMRLLIDFHYSDSWADPGKQNKPAAWASLDLAALQTALAQHTTSVLNVLKTNGISPYWVQVGNEVNDGMLWPTGKASVNMGNFAQLVNSGYNAVKSVFPEAKVIVHLSNGWDNSLYRWLFDGLKNNGAKWDMIGLSLYPGPNDWQSRNVLCLANMNDLVDRYGTPVMVVEVGMSWDNPSGARAFLADLIAKTRSVNRNMGMGVLYWEPQSYGNWQGYTLGAFDNSGKPTEALQAFK